MVTQETELDTLFEIAGLLAHPCDQRELLHQSLEVLETHLGLVRGSVMLALPDGEELVVEVHAPGTAAGNGHARHAGEIAGKVFETGRPAVVLSHTPARSPANGKTAVSSLCVPIVAGHEVVGTLSADLLQRDPATLESEQKVLSIVAGIIASDVRSRRAARLERESLESENQRLLSQLKEQYRPEGLVGTSRVMREVFLRIHQVASSDIPMLIRGEPGTGKELVASAIHFSSARAGRPFVRVNCASLGESQIESELFGHERGGAGAPFRRIGRIEEAEGGTLFLDEIGDFTPSMQVKLLAVIQEGVYERAGASQTRKANVRIIAATGRNLEAAVQHGTFRQDLYYRINIFPIQLPPLRERRDDILLLANHFIQQYAGRSGKTIRRISTSAINMLMSYHWPGNVRELENCIEHAILMSSDDVIQGHNLPPTLQAPDGSDRISGGTLKQQIHVLERDAIMDSLKRAGGSIATASRELGITGRMVRYKIKQLEIDYKGLFSRRRN